MRFTVESDIGRKRALNEDRAVVLTNVAGLQLAIVADGMGGHNAGDVASTMAVEGFASAFNAVQTPLASMDEKRSWLKHTVQTVNQVIYDYSLTHDECRGMGTTLIAALVEDDAAMLCHIGDSRAYVISKEKIAQITRDHSYVNMLVETGQISEEEAQVHPQKNYILKSLGTEATIEPDYYQVQLLPYSYLLICSDGLSNKLSAAELHSIVVDDRTLVSKGQQLIRLANDYGGEDNISCVLLEARQEEV